MYCPKKGHKAKILVTETTTENKPSKNGRMLLLIKGICPLDGTRLTMISKNSAFEATEGEGLSKMYVPGRIDPADEISDKVLQLMANDFSKVGNGLSPLMLSLAPALIPMIPDLVRGIIQIAGKGLTFPNNNTSVGSGMPVSDILLERQSLTSGNITTNNSGAPAKRDAVKDLELIAKKVVRS